MCVIGLKQLASFRRYEQKRQRVSGPPASVVRGSLCAFRRWVGGCACLRRSVSSAVKAIRRTAQDMILSTGTSCKNGNLLDEHLDGSSGDIGDVEESEAEDGAVFSILLQPCPSSGRTAL